MLAAALEAEYVAAYACAQAYATRSKKPKAAAAESKEPKAAATESKEPTAAATEGKGPSAQAIWAAAHAEQAEKTAMLAAAIIEPLLSVTPVRRWAPATPQDARRFDHAFRVGLLRGVDHDVVWGHLERIDAENLVARKLGRNPRAVAAMVRRQRGGVCLGLASLGPQHRVWLQRAKRTLWYARLKPLHPPLLTEQVLGVSRASLEKLRQRAVAAPPARTLRKSHEAPTARSDAEQLLPPTVWARVEPLLPLPSPRQRSPRETLLAVLVVVRHGIDWQSLAPSLGLGSGAAALRRVRAWQAIGAWRAVQATLEAHLADGAAFDFARLGATAPRRRARSRHG